MKKICIFGANGFIGSNLLPKFEKDFFNTAVIRTKKIIIVMFYQN